MTRLGRFFSIAVVGAGVVALPVSAQTLCQFCKAPPQSAKVKSAPKPLHIDIETMLDFSVAAHTNTGAGTIEIDPQTGMRRVSGGLVALGGSALRGVVTLTGEPFSRVTITVPAIIKLTSTRGDKADVTDIQTSLPPNPLLDASGRLIFTFGGRFNVQDSAVGDFHGRIHISADYQ